jgi:hypothetical protein
MISRLHVRDVRTNRLDHTCALMTQDRRTAERGRSFQVMQITVTQAGCSHPDQDFSSHWTVDAHIFDPQLSRTLKQHCSFHTLSSVPRTGECGRSA